MSAIVCPLNSSKKEKKKNPKIDRVSAVQVDRVYLNTPTKIAVIDHERKRTIELRKEGMPNGGKEYHYSS